MTWEGPRLTLRYDPTFARPNTWIVNAEGDGIRARVHIGQAPEHVLDIRLRCKTPAAMDPSAVHMRQIDGETWMLASSVYHPDMPRLELALIGAPEMVVEILRRL